MRFAKHTVRGARHDQNEDSVFVDEALGLCIVADGMGGHEFGRESGFLAVEAIASALENGAASHEGALSPDAALVALETGYEAAHNAIRSFAERENGGMVMGSTATSLLLLPNGEAVCGHVGDSRLYRVRGGEVSLLTHDHTVAQEAVDIGRITPEEAERSPYSNALTRVLGGRHRHDGDFLPVPLCHDDFFVLCSDGLPKALGEARLRVLLAQMQQNVHGVAGLLIDAVNDGGAGDDVSFVVVGV